MKKTNYHLLSLLCAVPLVLTGCNTGEGGGNTPAASAKNPAVSSVKITGADETTVLDGTRVSLKANVTADEGASTKVSWKSSDDKIATVTNGVVNFLKVSEEKKVTITATSVADANKSDAVEFTVKHSPFDLRNSRGGADTSLYLEDGSFIVEDPQDIALIYADVNHTRWYVEATLQIDSFLEGDPYPKVGIMASDRDDGMWCYEHSHQLFYCVYSDAAASTWSAMNVVMEDSELTNWNWGGQLSPATASPAIKKGEPFKMGLMRDGNKFYQFYGKATDLTLGLVGSFEYNSFGENANYVWVGGWAAGMIISDPKSMVGNEIDTLYTIPEGLRVNSAEETLYIGKTHQIEVSADGLWDRNKITYTSSDETIATVDENGLVTAAADKTGTATITVALQGTELSATVAITVTDDATFRVELDGEMNDLIWSDEVKTNAYILKKSDKEYVKIYGAKNSKGLYMFLDYNVLETARCNPNEWWTWENVEFRLADNEMAWGGQYWVSSMNGGSFVSVGTGEKPEQVYYKPLALGDDNVYHGAFEMFVPYGDDKVAKDQATYACFGWAPKSGWQQGSNWYAGITENTLKITANGFAHDGTKCSEGHAYGNWITDVNPNCSEEGSAHRDCAICGHRETKVLEIEPEAHVYDYSAAQVATEPTCMSTGVGTCACTKCGHIQETVLPRDYTKHTDAEYPTTHNHCHDCGVGSYLANAEGDIVNHNFGGWDNKSTWYDLGVLAGDFVFTLEFHMDGCIEGDPNDPRSSCWRTVLPVLYKEGWESDGATGNRVNHVFRMDWFGWDDGQFTSSANNGATPAGFDWNINYQAFSNMDVKLVVTKTGANVALDWVWTPCTTEGSYANTTFEYHQGCVLLDAYVAKVGLALSAEWTNYTITKAQLAR